MPTNLTSTLQNLLIESLAAPLGGSDPPVQLTVTSGQLQFLNEPSSRAANSDPRPDDRTDLLPFDAANPAGPYTLTQIPYPGARRVRLVTPDGDRMALTSREVIWEETDARQFSLSLNATRDPAPIAQVEVLYGVTAIFTTLYATQQITLTLTRAQSSDTPLDLDEVAALAIAIVELNRQPVTQTAQTMYEAGDYGMNSQIDTLRLVTLNVPTPEERQLILEANITLKATQALGDQVGTPIRTLQLINKDGSVSTIGQR